jgi:hypothetical protein
VDAVNDETPEFSDESDIDEALDNIPDEDWDKIMEELEAQHFETEEEAKTYFDGKLKDWSRTHATKRKVEVDERAETDPYYALLKEEPEITSRFSNYFDLEDRDADAYLDRVEKSIGRYPIGFRHYENYENYRVKYPDATIHDYQVDMNRQVEYHEYRDINKAAFLQECKNPYYMWKNKLGPWDTANLDENLTPESFVASEFFEIEMRKVYQ